MWIEQETDTYHIFILTNVVWIEQKIDTDFFVQCGQRKKPTQLYINKYSVDRGGKDLY